MILGAHVSTAGGVHNSPGNGLELGCQSIQIFTRNQRQWKAKPLTDSEVEGVSPGTEAVRHPVDGGPRFLPAEPGESGARCSFPIPGGVLSGAGAVPATGTGLPGRSSRSPPGVRGVGGPAGGCRQPEPDTGAESGRSHQDPAGNHGRAGKPPGVPLRAPGGNPLSGAGTRTGGRLRGHLPHFCGRLRYSGRSRLPSDTRTNSTGSSA